MNKRLATLVLAIAAFGSGQAKEPESSAAKQALAMILHQTSNSLCHHNDSSSAERQNLIREIDKIKTPGITDEAGLTPIDYAVLADDPKSIIRLISIGYDPRNQYNNPLTGAASANSPNAMKALLEYGISPNMEYPSNSMPLLEAVAQNRKEMIEMLFRAGANPNPTWDNKPLSVLNYAMPCKDQALIDLLIANGVKPTQRTDELAKKFGLSIGPKR